MNKIDRIIELLESIESKLDPKPKRKPKKVGEVNDGGFWQFYSEAFRNRYKVEPERNAMINGMIAGIKKRVAREELESLVTFYLSQNDSWYLREMHHVRCLVKDCEILLTRMKSKVVITSGKAREMEKVSENISESERYLKNKYGRN